MSIPNDSYDSAYVTAISMIEIPKKVVKPFGPTNKIIVLPSDNGIGAGQCVGYIQHVTGVKFSGNANTWTRYINSRVPTVGAIVVQNLSRFGHIGVIVKVTDDKIIVRSRNIVGLWIVSDNTYNINDPRNLGYIVY